METHLQTLRLVLNDLDVPLDTSSIQGRIAMQKAIYLAQVGGIPLGYQFSWYVKGPYSRSLADDYYRASIEQSEFGDRGLKREVRDQLMRLKALFAPPAEAAISRSDWLELLASWQYLRTRANKAQDEAEQMMQRQKPHIAAEVRAAERALQEHGLLIA